MVAIRELLKDHLLKPSLWMLAVLLTAGVSLGAYFASGGAMFSPGELSERARTQKPLGGVNAHANLSNNCAACHAPPFAGGTTADRCMECHATIRSQIDAHGPMHGKIPNSENCRACHTEHKGAHAHLTSFADFNHNWTAFKLTGQHRKIEDCSACHKNENYQGTPQTCAACHAEPTVHKGRFGNNCVQCHTTATFVVANGSGKSLQEFDHDTTGFKLTNKHAKTDCRQCHVNNTFKGTPTSCASCHAEPVVHKGKFDPNCAKCHTTATFVLAVADGKDLKNFDHDTTSFKLTGKHAMTDCRQCHVKDTFRGTPKTCASCHAEPAVHKGRFGTGCAECHTTSTWSGAVFKHAVFPINHREKSGNPNTCATCHDDQSKFVNYTCYNCHAHTKTKEIARHQRRKNIDVATIDNCIKCHAKDRKKGRTIAEAAPLGGIDACCEQFADGGMFTSCPAAASSAISMPRDYEIGQLLKQLLDRNGTAPAPGVRTNAKSEVAFPASAPSPRATEVLDLRKAFAFIRN